MVDNPEPQYVTFVNPLLPKGVAVFARIAIELNRKRPDIPLLIVEGRGTSEALARLPVDLSGLTKLHRTTNMPHLPNGGIPFPVPLAPTTML